MISLILGTKFNFGHNFCIWSHLGFTGYETWKEMRVLIANIKENHGHKIL